MRLQDEEISRTRLSTCAGVARVPWMPRCRPSQVITGCGRDTSISEHSWISTAEDSGTGSSTLGIGLDVACLYRSRGHVEIRLYGKYKFPRRVIHSGEVLYWSRRYLHGCCRGCREPGQREKVAVGFDQEALTDGPRSYLVWERQKRFFMSRYF